MVDHDEAMARLRDSDPATGSHPDLNALRSLVAGKAPASQGTDHVTAVHDDLMRGPSLRAPWIAAAAVAALGFGGGGYALGAAGGGETPIVSASSTEDDSRDDGTDSGTAGESAPLGDDGAAATAMPGVDAMGSDEKSMAGGSGAMFDMGPVRLQAGPGLSAERGTAPVRALTTDEDPAAFLAAWAERIDFQGVAPQPESEGAGWYGEHVLIEVDTMRVLSVSTAGGALQLSYEDQLRSPYCTDMYEGMSAEDLATMKEEFARAMGPDIPFPDQAECQPPDGALPTTEQAVAAAKDFFASTGLDVSDYTLQASEYQDPGVNYVMVEGWPEGQRGGELMINASVGPDGVYSAWGAVGEMTSLGDYPVISAVEAVERYGQRAFAVEYTVTLAEDLAAQSGPTDSLTMPVPEYDPPESGPLAPGDPLPLLMADKVVTDAELTSGTMWTSSGSVEVPAWKLVTDDGAHYSVLALTDESIKWVDWRQ
ncbi:hypothetical protein [Ornithinimicrobium tianjinense]|uniref:Uncharacterized protein n=1 Tax=Ornithinimicrobium tianjinense TaxID=1195761 RepID=A0A917F7B1_9MICO|nr:hypothetical protein [Ornithinimicrobium tianjinense]GGF55218.1 hypothetical protein GCM10011366_23910 [Ornithinimicrobium tianjinense]